MKNTIFKKYQVCKHNKVIATFATLQDAQQYIYLQENKELYYIRLIEDFEEQDLHFFVDKKNYFVKKTKKNLKNGIRSKIKNLR